MMFGYDVTNRSRNDSEEFRVEFKIECLMDRRCRPNVRNSEVLEY